MTTNKNHWTKEELQTYILLLCANSDAEETAQELNLIQSNVDAKTFEKMNAEFKSDTEDEALLKINASVQQHEFSHTELSELWKKMHEIFSSDSKFTVMESSLNRILENIIY